jgi:hypothetical protein
MVNAKILSYADIFEVQRRRAAKADANKAQLPMKRMRKAESRILIQGPEVRSVQIVKGLIAPCLGQSTGGADVVNDSPIAL